LADPTVPRDAAAMSTTTAPDLERMRTERHARLVDQMRTQGVDVLVATGSSSVAYATGAVAPAADGARAIHTRNIAVVTADGAPPELYTRWPDGVPDRHDPAHVHEALDLEWSGDAERLVRSLPGGRVAVDDCTMPLWAALQGRDLVDASSVIVPAKVVKTADELACIRRAQEINEAAITDVEAIVKPGVNTIELSGALLRGIFERGAASNTVDPIWQVMEREPARQPRSTLGDLVFPIPTRPRELVEGDLVWVDNGINFGGYQSDYGNAWIVGREPNAREREHHKVWSEVLDRAVATVRAGATCADLTAAAGEAFGRRPWLAHFYLAHGIGTESAELPYAGTDLGQAFDESFVLQTGMVLVFEPITWEDGVGGFRAEQIVAVTDDGHDRLSHVDTSAWD
jgi:Xaa-Pro dipeptidase